MRAIDIPNHNAQDVYQTCVNSISDDDLSTRLNAVTNDIVAAESDYKQKATTSQLYCLPPDTCGNNQVVTGTATKGDLKSVYSLHMVPAKKPARAIYDELRALAPMGKCPFCGFGQVSTLDHYLPKDTFPLLAIVPSNLVPACKDCNTDKGTTIATTEEEQCLHPYFDHQEFVNEQWLYAEVVETVPLSIRYYVQAPNNWSNIEKRRVESHFVSFKLGSRYAIEASDQLASLQHTLGQLDVNNRQTHLEREASSCFQQHPNSWQTAMFQSLAASNWYCDGGFNRA